VDVSTTAPDPKDTKWIQLARFVDKFTNGCPVVHMRLYFKKQYGIPTPKAISELGTAYKFVTGGAVDETEKDLMSMTFHDLFDNVSAGVCVCVCARVTTAARVTLIMQSPCPVSA